MEKKKKLIIGTSVATSVLLCAGLGLGLGLGLTRSKPFKNDPVLEKKYIEYRKDFVTQLCTNFYNEHKNEWKDEYTDAIKKDLNPWNYNLDTRKLWFDNWITFVPNHNFNEISVDFYPLIGQITMNSKMTENENEWKFQKINFGIGKYYPEYDINHEPVFVNGNQIYECNDIISSSNINITINK